jgi:hypothetical protein
MMRGEAEFYGAVANSATKARQVASALDLIDYWNAGWPSFIYPRKPASLRNGAHYRSLFCGRADSQSDLLLQ